MDSFVINGGRRLAGTVDVSGSKNAALPALFATLLADGVSVVSNVPSLRDIRTVVSLLEGFGARVSMSGSTMTVDTRPVATTRADYELVKTMRASILALGPLLARYGTATVSLPGGCAIGARPIDQHIAGLGRMGATIRVENGYVHASCTRLKGAAIYLDMPTVGGTEQLLMAAALADGETVIENAAREPEIVDLCAMLAGMGACITGAGTSTIRIVGVPSLRPARHRVMPDRIEAATFACAAAITGGKVTVRGLVQEHLDAALFKLADMGVRLTGGEDGVTVEGPDAISPVNLTTRPFPGFPTDLQSVFMACLAVADGCATVKEQLFENRMMHVPELNRLGADIRCSGACADIRGVDGLSGAKVMATDLRAGAALVLAALAADGESRVDRVYHIDRGYERFVEKLTHLGADIRRVPGEAG